MGWIRVGSRRPGWQRCLAVSAVLAAVAGCGGHHDPLSGPDATPVVRTATATIVDVCDLVPAVTASRLLDRPLLVVGRVVGASRDATVECQLGQRFGEPLVTVTLAPDPVARDVFDAAFGDRAGGNPVHVERLGDAAYMRTEGTNRVMHVLVHGAVLAVGVRYAPAGGNDSATKVELVRLSRAAVNALPENPAIESLTAPRRCNGIDATVIANTLGRPPSLDAGLAFSRTSLICSWSGQPGVVTASMTVGADDVGRFLQTHPLDQDIPVTGVLPAGQGQAASSPDEAGDLVVLLGDDRLLVLQVVPAAGYADDGIDTSSSELKVAEAALAMLTQMR